MSRGIVLEPTRIIFVIILQLIFLTMCMWLVYEPLIYVQIFILCASIISSTIIAMYCFSVVHTYTINVLQTFVLAMLVYMLTGRWFELWTPSFWMFVSILIAMAIVVSTAVQYYKKCLILR